MYNSFGVIQNNFQKRLTVKHKVRVFLPHSTAGFYVSFSVLGRVSTAQTDRTYSLLNENCSEHHDTVLLNMSLRSLASALWLCGTFPVKITAGPK